MTDEEFEASLQRLENAGLIIKRHPMKDLVYPDRSTNESWDGATLNEWLADGGLPTDGYDPYLDFTSDDDDDEDEDEQEDEDEELVTESYAYEPQRWWLQDIDFCTGEFHWKKIP